MFKRLKMINSLKKKMIRRGNVFEVTEKQRVKDEHLEEERELMFIKHRVNDKDYQRYEWLFR